MDITLWMALGFLLAAYSVIANDSVQTLGTFIASNSHFKWYYLWAATSSVLLLTLWGGWVVNEGDISYGRLNQIPFMEVQWFHALAPGVLLLLTRVGVPVSTSFLVLSVFASGVVLEKMLLKSVVGYGLAAISAYVIWYVIHKIGDGTTDIKQSHKPWWRIGQWVATGLLWFAWLSHDLANISVFLPRVISIELMFVISVVFLVGLGWMFKEGGGKIQEIIIEKHNTKYVRSATVIIVVYAIILYVFKELNDVPMSTTFVFLGLLAGRELAIASCDKMYKFKSVFPLLGKDFLKLSVGLGVSIVIVLSIHYFGG